MGGGVGNKADGNIIIHGVLSMPTLRGSGPYCPRDLNLQPLRLPLVASKT